MYNQCILAHNDKEGECNEPQFQINTEKKWGLCWRYTLRCNKCSFVSQEYKLYKEVHTNKPGQNPAQVNLSLAVGMQDNPVGPTAMRRLLCAMNVDPPCQSNLQRSANIVGDKITVLNKKDMDDKIEIVKSVNEQRGNVRNVVNIATDGTYNTSAITSRKKPGQNASFAVSLAVENITDKQYIIAVSTKSKLCWKGAWLRSRGFNVHCPNGHADCTADTPFVKPFSEFEMGQDIGEQLACKDIFVKYVTTDGDGLSAAGVGAAMKVMDNLWKVERLADPTHLGQAQFRECLKADFSSDIFPSVTTRTKKHELQKILSMDLKARSSLILKELMKTYSGNIDKIKKVLPKVVDTTLRCYGGDCSMCRRHSVVCDGGVRNNWWYRSMFLGPHHITALNLKERDITLLRELLLMKLSEGAVESMKLNTSTQKNEAAHRSLHVSLPKNVNFARNSKNRTHSFIHRLNNSVGASTISKCECVGAKLSPKVQQVLRKMDADVDYQKKYRKRKDVINRQMKSRGLKYYEHHRYKTEQTVPGYRKGMLDPRVCAPRDNKKDHNYNK